MGREILKLGQDERGVSAVEYGLICALIVLAMLAALSQVASATTSMWNTVTETSDKAINGEPT
jgi:pilus assembly protein Flp/PilA